jgi:hypothetical protein
MLKSKLIQLDVVKNECGADQSWRDSGSDSYKENNKLNYKTHG